MDTGTILWYLWIVSIIICLCVDSYMCWKFNIWGRLRWILKRILAPSPKYKYETNEQSQSINSSTNPQDRRVRVRRGRSHLYRKDSLYNTSNYDGKSPNPHTGNTMESNVSMSIKENRATLVKPYLDTTYPSSIIHAKREVLYV